MSTDKWSPTEKKIARRAFDAAYQREIAAVMEELRKRVGRTLNKLFTPNLEKALTFLEDPPRRATSNAVERSNRRFRKARRTVYGVCTAGHIRQRTALDMERDPRAPNRITTVATLHLARNDNKGRNKDATASVTEAEDSRKA